MIKIILCICFSLMLLTMFGFSAFAAEKPTFYSEKIKSTLNEQFVMSVKLKGNTGVMGF